MDGQLVGVAELAQRAGVKPDTVYKWRRRHDDFPHPVARLQIGVVWDWTEVEVWLAKPRTVGRPPVRS